MDQRPRAQAGEGGDRDGDADFDRRLAAAKARRRGWDVADDPSRRTQAEGLGAGMRIAVEFVAAIGVACGIGWLLDHWLGTTPWLLVVMLPLGLAAGVMNVYRTAMELDRRAKERRATGTGDAPR